MDTSGHLREIYEDEFQNFEDLEHPVDSKADLPPEKLALFEAVDDAGGRKDRKIKAKELGVKWSEYQIFKKLR